MMLSLIAWLAMAAGEPDRAVDIAALTKAKEVDWNGYYRRQDADGLARFLDDDFVHFQADGTIETKDQAVDWVRNNSWDVGGTFKYVVSDIAFYGPDTANVYGVGSFDTDECRMSYVSSNILIRKEDGWHPIFSHSSPPSCISEESE